LIICRFFVAGVTRKREIKTALITGVNMEQLFEDNFERFWNTWPKSFRKGGKSACRVKWKKFYCDSCADQIIKHIEWMKTTDAWRKDDGAFIPAPLVYLNQQRWDGAEIPEGFGIKVEVKIDPALAKIEADRKKAAPMPEHIRARLAELRK
jgi:hypothetical protein